MMSVDWGQFGMTGLFIAYLIYQSEVKDKRIIAVLQRMERRLEVWEEHRKTTWQK